MLVYVLNENGQPLMPTDRCGKVRRLLKTNKAKVLKRCPFTIQLLYKTETEVTQPVRLGVDAGSVHIGLSATTKKDVLYESEVMLRNDMVKLMSVRRELRRSRRARKTRYRKARFNNRISSKKPGWIAPSIRQKIESHLAVIEKVYRMLPIKKIVVETASFDIQKIKNPEIQGSEYQQGEQLGFWNTREYVLFRDGHICQCCKGKSKDPILNVHHIRSRQVGGDAPDNLVTLCETCHKGYHKGTVKLPESIKRKKGYAAAAFMGIVRWTLYNTLKELHPNVSMTFGYITKNTRIENNLPKEHYVDARCISGNPLAKPSGVVYYMRKIRRHNRQLYKAGILKDRVRKRNQADYVIKGFRLFDKVLYNDQECFVFGRRSSGYFDLRKIDGTVVNRSANCRAIKFVSRAGGYIISASPFLSA